MRYKESVTGRRYGKCGNIMFSIIGIPLLTGEG
jgi:hypothetical protein